MEKTTNINRRKFFTGFSILGLSFFASKMLPFGLHKFDTKKRITIKENPEAVKRVK